MTQLFANHDAPGAPGSDVGAILASQRDALGWSLEDIGDRLRIRPEFLAALEAGRVDTLPGPAYATGFLKAYADFIGLDGLEIVRRFKGEQADLRLKPALTFPMPLTERGLPGSSLVVMALIIFGVGYGTWWYVSSGTGGAPPAVEPVPTALLNPPRLDPPTVTPDAAAAAEPRAAPAAAVPVVSGPTPAVPATAAPAGPAAPVQTAALPPGAATAPGDPHVYGNPGPGAIVVKATADSWVEVLDDTHSIWHGLMKAGDVYNPPKDGLTLRTGNAGAIAITVNGKPVPPIGALGEVKRVALDPAKLGG